MSFSSMHTPPYVQIHSNQGVPRDARQCLGCLSTHLCFPGCWRCSGETTGCFSLFSAVLALFVARCVPSPHSQQSKRKETGCSLDIFFLLFLTILCTAQTSSFYGNINRLAVSEVLNEQPWNCQSHQKSSDFLILGLSSGHLDATCSEFRMRDWLRSCLC